MSLKLQNNILNLYGNLRQRFPYLINRPLGYFFYITGRCNLNCDFCWQRETKNFPSANTMSSKNELSGEEWIKVIDSIPKPSFIGLSGGEPLLHPDLNKITQYISGKYPYTVNTNGALLDEKRIRMLIANKVSNISVSLDGFSEIHDKMRKRPGLFNKVIENIKLINKIKRKMNVKKPTLTIKNVLSDEMIEHMEEFYKFCDDELNANSLNIALIRTRNNAQLDFRTYDSLADIRKLGIPRCHNYRFKNKIPDVLDKINTISKKRKCKVVFYPRMSKKSSIMKLIKNNGIIDYGPCYIPYAIIVILANGAIIPCLSIRIENIRNLNYDVKKICRIKKYQNFLKWRKNMNISQKSPSECNMCCFSNVK